MRKKFLKLLTFLNSKYHEIFCMDEVINMYIRENSEN